MSSVRPAAVAGSFYPEAPKLLRQEVSQLIRQSVADQQTDRECPKILVVPHAGIRYSGVTAGAAYARLLPYRDKIKRVVMIGPSHRVSFKGLAVEASDMVETPLGAIKVDHTFVAPVIRKGLVVRNAEAHAAEHSLEVQWAFLQVALDDFSVVPIVTGEVEKHHVLEALMGLWGGQETLIVISTDLSHFHSAEDGQRIDQQTCDLIRVGYSQLSGKQACGFKGLNAVTLMASHFELPVEQIEYSHSGMHGGPMDSVVGYGAFEVICPVGFKPEIDRELREEDKPELLALARDTLRTALCQEPITLDTQDWPIRTMMRGASFVSLHKKGQLRGCVGTLVANQPLAVDVVQNVIKAAFNDPRFPKVEFDEFYDLEIEISVLTEAKPMSVNSEEEFLAQIRPGIDGVILRAGNKQATFLPLVWRTISEPKAFLEQLKNKARIKHEGWPRNMVAWTYQTVAFTESDFVD